MLEIYVSGIDDNSGKILVTAGLAGSMQGLGYETCVYKPVQTGAKVKDGFAQSPDLAYVKLVDPYIKTYFSYIFQHDDVPLLAAEKEKTPIEKNVLNNDYISIDGYDCVITDGACGLSTPLAHEFLEQNFVKMLNLPVLFVVSNSSVNNIIANLNEAAFAGVRTRGVVINNCGIKPNKSLSKLIENYTNAKVIGEIPYYENLKKINPNDVMSIVLENVDIESVFDLKIPKLNSY